MLDFYSEHHSILASTAAILTVFACVMKFIYHAINRKIRKIVTFASGGILVVWIILLLTVFVTSADPLRQIDVVLISLLVYILMSVIVLLFLDLEKIHITHQTKQKYDVFTIGDDD